MVSVNDALVRPNWYLPHMTSQLLWITVDKLMQSCWIYQKHLTLFPTKSYACHKLSSYGICGKLLNWISAFLTGRCQNVILNGEISHQPCSVTSGVPQGSVLGPLLFLYYINDIPKIVKSSIKLYTDDALLCRNINLEEDIRILQEDLSALVLWAKKWQMNFDPECMTISNKLNLPNLNYCIDNIVIKQVEHAKYLGVTI